MAVCVTRLLVCVCVCVCESSLEVCVYMAAYASVPMHPFVCACPQTCVRVGLCVLDSDMLNSVCLCLFSCLFN